MAIYNNATGELICEEKSVFGQGDPTNRFDEPGYIAVPPCMWSSSPADGLSPPPDLTGVTLRVIKRCNATYGHHGTQPLPTT